MSNEKFIDDVIEHKEDDIEKIQTKPKTIGHAYSDVCMNSL